MPDNVKDCIARQHNKCSPMTDNRIEDTLLPVTEIDPSVGLCGDASSVPVGDSVPAERPSLPRPQSQPPPCSMKQSSSEQNASVDDDSNTAESAVSAVGRPSSAPALHWAVVNERKVLPNSTQLSTIEDEEFEQRVAAVSQNVSDVVLSPPTTTTPEQVDATSPPVVMSFYTNVKAVPDDDDGDDDDIALETHMKKDTESFVESPVDAAVATTATSSSDMVTNTNKFEHPVSSELAFTECTKPLTGFKRLLTEVHSLISNSL